MAQGSSKLKCVWLAAALLAACGGGGGEKKPDVKKPEGGGTVKKDPPPKAETEEDRIAKREAAAKAIVPEGSSCLPPALRETGAPKLELADVGGEIVVCATDIDTTRLLGPVACWKVGLTASPLTLSYMPAAPLPGHSVSVRLEGACARGYCIPDEAKPTDPVVHLAWSMDSKKVAVLAGDNVHLFDAGSKAHESTFGIRGDAGVTNDPISVHWVGDRILIEGADQGPNANVWVFQTDGTAVGPIKSMDKKDPKPLSTYGGSFLVIDGGKGIVGIAEQGFSTLTEYTVANGARTKHVRKLPKSPCKPAEATDFWAGKTDGLPPKCAEYMTKNFSSLVGADLLAGTKSFVVLLRGPRLGEIAVMDKKSLLEKSTLQLPWCDAASADAGAEAPAPE